LAWPIGVIDIVFGIEAVAAGAPTMLATPFVVAADAATELVALELGVLIPVELAAPVAELPLAVVPAGIPLIELAALADDAGVDEWVTLTMTTKPTTTTAASAIRSPALRCCRQSPSSSSSGSDAPRAPEPSIAVAILLHLRKRSDYLGLARRDPARHSSETGSHHE